MPSFPIQRSYDVVQTANADPFMLFPRAVNEMNNAPTSPLTAFNPSEQPDPPTAQWTDIHLPTYPTTSPVTQSSSHEVTRSPSHTSIQSRSYTVTWPPTQAPSQQLTHSLTHLNTYTSAHILPHTHGRTSGQTVPRMSTRKSIQLNGHLDKKLPRQKIACTATSTITPPLAWTSSQTIT